ncbi:endolytic transglycosylase MltG [Pseudofrankia inefficax]|uniref:Endolytic murein transglycosylase n=1 Tax=Pseudofrankia inefficax (strain DSM 45817 / CECT 9037 / DDB 130130 / EuI1c) TaxID=298654 RepID=E3J8Z2_PSEI1|nr:endolytic transglycosylase MltG [Pseudofrankia inefficax]ADP79725.1 aminodeoxychorismate lyase [Pseudofrankia inefficax]
MNSYDDLDDSEPDYDGYDGRVAGFRSDDGRRRRSRRGRALTKLLVLLVVLAALLGGGIYAVGSLIPRIGGSTAAKDYPGPGTGSVEVRVGFGDSATDIATSLHKAGVIASTRAFVSVARADPRAEQIQPGAYQLARQMSAREAFLALLDPANNRLRLTITEGETVQQVLKDLSKRMGVPVATYEAIVRGPAGKLDLPSYANGLVEGYLFPDTYLLDPRASPAETLQMFIGEFSDKAAGLGLESGAARLGLTPAQVVIVASILEKEVRNPPEYPMAARVIYNRLADPKDFPTLGMDSTTRYAENNYEGPLTQSQLTSDNPYNTRKIKGLPPGPISNPGELALNSALNPAAGSWNYFVSMPNGQTKFATTEQEFEQLLAEYHAAGGTAGG